VSDSIDLTKNNLIIHYVMNVKMDKSDGFLTVFSFTPFLPSWPKAMFLSFLTKSNRQQKTAAQPSWSEQPLALMGLRFLCFVS
jgi:hypothetical protein